MSEAIEILQRKRTSLDAARKSTYDGAADNAFVRGLRAGLNIAVQALDEEITWMEKWEASKAALDAAEAERVA